MPKVIGYGAVKSAEEKQRDSFQRQIKELMFRMDIRDKRIIGETAALSKGRIYKLWHDPCLMKENEATKLWLLFDRYGLVFDRSLGMAGGANA